MSTAMEHALGEALAEWSGSLTRERPGRCWLLAPGTDGVAAERLVARLRDGCVRCRATGQPAGGRDRHGRVSR